MPLKTRFYLFLVPKRLFIGGASFIYQLDAFDGLPIYVRDTLTSGQVRTYPWEVRTQFVHTLAVHNRTLYFGGGFRFLWTSKDLRATGVVRNSLAAINIDSLAILDWNPNLGIIGSSLDYEYGVFYNTFVGKISIVENLAYIAGGFGLPSRLGARSLAAIDIRTAVPSRWTPIDSSQTAINRMMGRDTVFLGGYPFYFDNGLIYSGISPPSAIDTTGSGREIWKADTAQKLYSGNALLVHNNVIYAGGSGLAAFKAYTRPLTTAVAQAQTISSSVPLLSVHPNPTNGVALASYHLPAPSPIRLELFDVLGRSLRILAQETQTAGEHTTLLPTSDLRAGVYFLVLESANGKTVQRVVVGR